MLLLSSTQNNNIYAFQVNTGLDQYVTLLLIHQTYKYKYILSC